MSELVNGEFKDTRARNLALTFAIMGSIIWGADMGTQTAVKEVSRLKVQTLRSNKSEDFQKLPDKLYALASKPENAEDANDEASRRRIDQVLSQDDFLATIPPPVVYKAPPKPVATPPPQPRVVIPVFDVAGFVKNNFFVDSLAGRGAFINALFYGPGDVIAETAPEEARRTITVKFGKVERKRVYLDVDGALVEINNSSSLDSDA